MKKGKKVPNCVPKSIFKKNGVKDLHHFPKVKGGKLKATEVRNLLEASYEDEPKQNIGDWILDNGLSNTIAKVYYKPDGRAVVAHRGTSGALDWKNNLAYALGEYENTDRYKQGKDVQEQAEKKYGAKNISTLGHSQGAVLSRKLGKNTKEIINVNPAYKGETQLANEYNVRSDKDVVSGLSAPISFINRKLYPTYTNKHSIIVPTEKSFDVLGNHSYDILKKIGDKEIGAGIKKRRKQKQMPTITEEEEVDKRVIMPSRIEWPDTKPSVLHIYSLYSDLTNKLKKTDAEINELFNEINNKNISTGIFQDYSTVELIQKQQKLVKQARDYAEQINKLDPEGLFQFSDNIQKADYKKQSDFLQNATGKLKPFTKSYFNPITGKEVTGAGREYPFLRN